LLDHSNKELVNTHEYKQQR